MKALTVCQPYAWALIRGPKRFENRKRCTWYRGPLLIHAGKSKSWWPREPVLEDGTPIPPPIKLAWGAIIGRVDLVDCVRVTDERVKGKPFAWGPWCWVTENPVPIFPIPYRGQISLFDVPGDLLPSTLFAETGQ